MKLQHQWAPKVAAFEKFLNISNYDELDCAIQAWVDELPDTPENENERKDRAGLSFEVYAEFWLKRYCVPENPLLGLKNMQHTSDDKFQAGYDFVGQELDGSPAFIQIKHFADPAHLYGLEVVSKFVMKAIRARPNGRVWFHNNFGVEPFTPPVLQEAKENLRVFDRRVQEEFILRDPAFWSDFAAALRATLVRPVRDPLPKLWEHQVEMLAPAVNIVNADAGRGRFICATGGGKTRVEAEALRAGFKRGFKLQVHVAPTIELLKQTHVDYWKLQLLDDLAVVHFRTGADPETESKVHLPAYTLTTCPEELFKFIDENKDRSVLVFVTYASEENFFAALESKDLRTEMVVFDEFHHLVQQKQEAIDHLLELPANRVLFFSASEKQGRKLSSNREDVFGPRLADIKFKRLVDAGHLVPPVVRPLRIDRKGLRGLEMSLKERADNEGFSLRETLYEGAAIVVARKHMLETYGRSNLITFGKAVAGNNELVRWPELKTELLQSTPGKKPLLATVSAKVSSRDRKGIMDDMKKSDDSVLVQHSIMKEGIDSPGTNGIIISRGMDVVGYQQAIGRAVRAAPGKTEAGVYVIIHDDQAEETHQFLDELVQKLMGCGLDWGDVKFEDITEERTGKKPPPDWLAKLPMPDGMGARLHEVVERMYVEHEEEWQRDNQINELRALSTDELLKLAGIVK